MTRSEMQTDMENLVGQAKKIMGDPAKADEYRTMVEKIRSLGDQIRAMDAAEAELRAVKDAEKNAPAHRDERASGWRGVAQQLRSVIESGRPGSISLGIPEIRAITANGAGVNTAPGIVKALVDGGKLRSKVSVFAGKNSQTVVPVFSPYMAVPVGTAEGATGTSSDSTAVLTGQTLTLKPWYSTLAVSMGALISTDIESYLPGIFEEAFGAAIDKAILVGAGSGNDALGVYVASASGVPTTSDFSLPSGSVTAGAKFSDYVSMALELLALGGDSGSLAFVVNPTIFNKAMAASNEDPMKVEFLTKGTILGVPVIFSSYCPTTLTAGSYIAVGGYFKHYALAVAQEITIDQIKTVGSDNVTFQAFMYMQGKPLVGSSFRRAKTVT